MTERKQGETPDEHHLSQWPRPTSRVISADYDVDSIHSWCDMMKMALYLGGLPPHNYKPSLPGKSHGWRSLVGCSPWGRWGSDTTERLHFHFSLSCIGEGNGNPLQCSCLENPRDGGVWWAAVYGVAQSRTWLKWLSSLAATALMRQTPVKP